MTPPTIPEPSLLAVSSSHQLQQFMSNILKCVKYLTEAHGCIKKTSDDYRGTTWNQINSGGRNTESELNALENNLPDLKDDHLEA